MKRCGEIRMLAAVAVLLIALVMAVGLVARDLAARRPRFAIAEHLIDQLYQNRAVRFHGRDCNLMRMGSTSVIRYKANHGGDISWEEYWHDHEREGPAWRRWARWPLLPAGE